MSAPAALDLGSLGQRGILVIPDRAPKTVKRLVPNGSGARTTRIQCIRPKPAGARNRFENCPNVVRPP